MAANPRNDQPRSYQSWTAITANPNDFNLDAGTYGLTVLAGGFVSYQLQRLLPDGATYAPASPVMAAAGYTVMDLPAGQYALVLVTPTAFTGVIEKIHTGRAR
jgi:hypothetical protein